jgi:hypothetical protein
MCGSKQIQRGSNFRRVNIPFLTLQDCGFENGEGFQKRHRRKGDIILICATQPRTPFTCQWNGTEYQDELVFKELFLLRFMTRKEIEDRLDELGRKYSELARKYVETRDNKKIVEELYEMVWELQKLKKALLY